MSDKIIQLNEGVIKQELKELVRNSVEETLNNLLDQEAAELTKAERYERTEERQGYRSGHYERKACSCEWIKTTHFILIIRIYQVIRVAMNSKLQH